MSMIKCTECGKEISDKATACPHCGCPMTEILSATKENKKEEKVYSLLDEIQPMTFENLLENSGYSAFELQHILMKFELKNIIYQIEQNVYLRKV